MAVYCGQLLCHRRTNRWDVTIVVCIYAHDKECSSLVAHIHYWSQHNHLDSAQDRAPQILLASGFQAPHQGQIGQQKLAGKVFGYIDAFKCMFAKILTVSDEELFDRFLPSLNAPVQHKVLKQDLNTFAVACQMAERLARLETVIDECFSNSSNNCKAKQHVWWQSIQQSLLQQQI